jgi:hypothetical protein
MFELSKWYFLDIFEGVKICIRREFEFCFDLILEALPVVQHCRRFFECDLFKLVGFIRSSFLVEFCCDVCD